MNYKSICLNYKSICLFQLTNILIFCFGALMLTVKGGYSYPIFALCILSILFAFKNNLKQAYLENKLWLLSFLAMMLLYLSYYLVEGGYSEKILRLLGIVLVFLFLASYKFSFRYLAWGFLVGGICAFILATYEKYYLGSSRAFTLIERSNAIQAGDIAMSMALILINFSVYFYRKKQWNITFIFVMGSLMALFASLLSGSRGGWVLLPIVLVMLFFLYRGLFNKRAKCILLIIVAMVAVLASFSQVGVGARITEAVHEVQHYKEWKDGSVGLRFQMWQSAWTSFKESPLIGHKSEDLLKTKDKQFAAGELTEEGYKFATYSHAHNAYLDIMQKRGLLGLFSLLAFFFIPLLLFKQQFKQSDSIESQTLAGAGMVVVVSVMDYCLTQGFFNHNSGLMFYTGSISIFYAYCVGVQRRKNKRTLNPALH